MELSLSIFNSTQGIDTTNVMYRFPPGQPQGNTVDFIFEMDEGQYEIPQGSYQNNEESIRYTFAKVQVDTSAVKEEDISYFDYGSNSFIKVTEGDLLSGPFTFNLGNGGNSRGTMEDYIALSLWFNRPYLLDKNHKFILRLKNFALGGNTDPFWVEPFLFGNPSKGIWPKEFTSTENFPSDWVQPTSALPDPYIPLPIESGNLSQNHNYSLGSQNLIKEPEAGEETPLVTQENILYRLPPEAEKGNKFQLYFERTGALCDEHLYYSNYAANDSEYSVRLAFSDKLRNFSIQNIFFYDTEINDFVGASNSYKWDLHINTQGNGFEVLIVFRDQFFIPQGQSLLIELRDVWLPDGKLGPFQLESTLQFESASEVVSETAQLEIAREIYVEKTLNEKLSLSFLNTSLDIADVIYIQDDTEAGDNIELTIGNDTGAVIPLSVATGTASESEFSFYLKFEPSVFEGEMVIQARTRNGEDGEWLNNVEDWDYFRLVSPIDNSITIYFQSRAGAVLETAFDSVKVVLQNVRPKRRGTSKVELYIREEGTKLKESFCLTQFNIESHLGQEFIPLKVAVDNWQLINNGDANNLELTLRNDSQYPIVFDNSTIEVSWDVAATYYQTDALCSNDGVPTQDQVQIFREDVTRNLDSYFVNFTTNNFSGTIAPQRSLPITIEGLSTIYPVGLVYIYINYYDVDGFWDGKLTVPLMRTNLIETGTRRNFNLGVGTKKPKGTLHVKGSLALGLDTNKEEDGRYLLHPRHENNGDFLSITPSASNGEWNWGGSACLHRNGNLALGWHNSPNKLSVSGNVSIGSDYTGTEAPPNGLLVEGRVGIGTKSPKGTMHVMGDLVLGLDDNPEVNSRYILHPKTNQNGDYLVLASSKANEAWDWTNATSFYKEGNLAIRGAGSGSQLSVNGNVTVGADYAHASPSANGLLVQGKAAIGTKEPHPANWLTVNGGVAIGNSNTGTAAPTNGLLVQGLMAIGGTQEDYNPKVSIVFPNNSSGLGIKNESSGESWFPWKNNWHYLSGSGAIFRDKDHTEKMRITTSTGELKVKGKIECTTQLKIGAKTLTEAQLGKLLSFLNGTLKVQIKSGRTDGDKSHDYIYASNSPSGPKNCYDVRYTIDGEPINSNKGDWYIKPE